MIIGKQPVAGSLMLPSIARQRDRKKYISIQPTARKDVAAIAGQPVSLYDEGHHLTCYIIAGQELVPRPYKLAADTDLDQELASLGCTRLTEAYRCIVEPSFSMLSGGTVATVRGLSLVKDATVGGWYTDDRIPARQGFVPAEGDVFMLLLLQDAMSSLMTDNTAFIAPYSDAHTLTKGSEFLVDGCLNVVYQSIDMAQEELRSMAFKGAN